MPRTTKEKPSSKPYDRPTLKAMKRPELQKLAKKEGIKANMKTEEIIVSLLMKREMLESVLPPQEGEQENASVAANVPVEIQTLQTPRRREDSPVIRAQQNANPQAQRVAFHLLAEVQGPQNDHQLELPESISMYEREAVQDTKGDLDLLAGVAAQQSTSTVASREVSVFSPPRAPRTPHGPSYTNDQSSKYRISTPSRFPARIPASPSSSASPDSPAQEPAEAVSAKMIRQYRRQWTKLRTKQAPLRQEIASICKLLDSTEEKFEKQKAELEDLRCMREATEHVLGQFRYNRHLYDGTGNMEARDAKEWQDACAKSWKPKALKMREDLDADSTADELEDGDDGVEAYGWDVGDDGDEGFRQGLSPQGPSEEEEGIEVDLYDIHVHRQDPSGNILRLQLPLSSLAVTMNPPLCIWRTPPLSFTKVVLPRCPSTKHAIGFKRRRHYTTPTNGTPHQTSTTPKKPPTPKVVPLPHSPRQTPPQARHEAHEGTSAINVPYNPPGGGPNIPGSGGSVSFTGTPFLDALLTTAVGLGAVFVGGVLYVKWYKKNVLDKIEAAFSPGYDPALELAKQHTTKKAPVDDTSVEPLFEEEEPWTQTLRRNEQDTVDHIIHGKESGHYFMLLGPKGSGKGTMIFDAMASCDADGVAMCDAHPDLEVFRLRLGKALNYEFNEDTQTGLFQRRDPREGGPALDIERAMNKLEKVALRCARIRGKPLVLIINNVHFFQNNDDGKHMLLQLQQKAEAWAASGILTMVFSSDDFWPFHVMRQSASRMHVISIYDLDPRESARATKRIRRSAGRPAAEPEAAKEALSLIGGRLSYLNKVSKAKDMVQMARHLLQVETGWLLSQIGLIPDCDDDVMDEQKWSSCSWLLLREFVKMRREQIAALAESGGSEEDLPLPSISWYKCRQIMTRADFMEELDRLNIISIDIQHNVRPDSNLILHAAQQVTEEEGFDELLQNVRDRIDEIESLHRTRELTFKDLDKGDMVRLAVDKRGEELLATVDDDDDS